MTELGDLGIGLELDLESFEQQLKRLEEYQGKPIIVPVKLDETIIKQQLQALKLDPIQVEVKLNQESLKRQLKQLNSLKDDFGDYTIDVDTSNSERSLERLSLRLRTVKHDIIDIKQELKGLDKSIKITTKVDDSNVRSELQNLGGETTRTVRLKVKTDNSGSGGLEGLDREINPVVRPIVDATQAKKALDELENTVLQPEIRPYLNPNSLEAQLSKLKPGEVRTKVRFELEKYPKIKVQFDTQDARRELELSRYPKLSQQSVKSAVPGLDPYVELSRNPKLKFNFDSEEIRGAIDRAAGSIVNAIGSKGSRVVNGNFGKEATSAVGSTASTLYEGFVTGLGDQLSQAITSAVLGSFTQAQGLLLKVFETGSGFIGKAVSFLASPLTGFINNFQAGIGQAFGAKFADGAASHLKGAIGLDAESLGATSAKRGIAKTSRSLQNLGLVEDHDDFKDLARKSIEFYEETAEAESLVAAARERYAANLKKVAQEIKTKGEALAQTLPDVAEPGQAVTYVSAGYAGQKGEASQKLAADFQAIVPQNRVVPVNNTHTDVKADALQDPGLWMLQAGANTLKNVVRGVNLDGAQIATQAYADHLKDPTAPISVAGHSAGGYAAQDAHRLLGELGVDSKALSFGTPHFNALYKDPDPSRYQAQIGVADPLAFLNAASPNKLNLFAGGAGHLSPSYTQSPEFQATARTFISGVHTPAAVAEPKDDLKELLGNVHSYLSEIKSDNYSGSLSDRNAQRYREGYAKSAELVKKRAAEIEVPDIAEGTKGLVLASGGYSGEKGLAANRLAAVTQEILPDHAVVPILNKTTDVNSFDPSLPAQMTANSLNRNVRGHNPDAIEAAAHAYAFKQKYPDLPVSSIGYSAGGFVATETSEILKRLGVESKAVSIGTPFLAHNTDLGKEQHLALAGNLDPFTLSKLAQGKVETTATTAGATHALPQYALNPDFQRQVSGFLDGSEQSVTDPARRKRIEAVLPTLPESFQSPRLQGEFRSTGPQPTGITPATQLRAFGGAGSLVAPNPTSVSDFLKKDTETFSQRAVQLKAELAKANAELDASFAVIEHNLQSQIARATKKSRKSFETQQKRDAYVASQQAAQPPPVSVAVVENTPLAPSRRSTIVGAEAPPDADFKTAIAERKALLKAEVAAAEKLTGQDKAAALLKIIQSIEREEARIQADIAQKFSRSASAQLAAYRTFLSSAGKKPGIKQGAEVALREFSPEAKFAAGEQLAQAGEGRRSALDTFAGGLNRNRRSASGEEPPPAVSGTSESPPEPPTEPPTGRRRRRGLPQADIDNVGAGLRQVGRTDVQKQQQVQQIYQKVVAELGKLHNIKIDAAQIPKLEISDQHTKAIGARAAYVDEIDDPNKIYIAKQVANELANALQDVEAGKRGIASLLHELTHGEQLGFGKTLLDDVLVGADKPARKLEKSNDPYVLSQAKRSTDLAVGGIEDDLPKGARSKIQALEVDAYSQERHAPQVYDAVFGSAPKADDPKRRVRLPQAQATVSNVSAQLRQQQNQQQGSFYQFSPNNSQHSLEFKPENNLAEFAAQSLPNSVTQQSSRLQRFGNGFNLGRKFADTVDEGDRILPGAGTRVQRVVVGAAAAQEAGKQTLGAFKASGGQLGIGGAIQGFKGAFASSFEGLEKGFNVGKKFEGVFGGLIKQGGQLKGAFNAGFNLDQPLRKLGAAADQVIPGISEKIGNLVKGFLAFQALNILRAVFVDFGKSAFEAFIEVDKLKTALDFASGGRGAASLKFVNSEVDRLKIPLQASVQGFTQLAAATKGSAIAGAQTNQIFTGLSEASTVLSLSAEDTQGAMLALSQTASKGIVSSEELRQQLGEKIPGAMSIAARSMNLTDEAFNKLLESGQILSNDFLPKFGKQLHDEFGEAAKTASGNAQSAVFNLGNAFLRLKQTTGESVSPVVTPLLNALANVMGFVASQASLLIIAAGTLGITLAIALGAAATVPLIGGVSALSLVVGGLTATLGAASKIAKTFQKEILSAALLLVAISLYKAIWDSINTDLAKSYSKAADEAERLANASANVKLPPVPGDKTPGKDKKDAPQAEEPAPLVGLDYLTASEISFEDGIHLQRQTGRTASTYGDLQRTNLNFAHNKEIEKDNQFTTDAGLRLNDLKTNGDPQFKDLDGQLQTAQRERNALQANIARDYTRKGLAAPVAAQQELDQKNLDIKDLNEKRAVASKPYEKDITTVNALINSQKGKIQALKEDPDTIKAVGGTIAAENEIKKREAALLALKKFKFDAEATLASLHINPLLALGDAFTKITAAIEGAERATKLYLSQQKNGIVQTHINAYGTDEDAGRKDALAQANTDRDGVQRNLDATEKGLKDGAKELDRPETEEALKGYGVSKESSIEDIDKELKATPDDESGKGKRKILEQLKAYKELQQKKADLQVNLGEADLKIKDQVQTNTLAVLDRDAGKRDQALKQDDAARAIPIRKASADLVRDKANNKFFSDADAGVVEADLGIKSARNQVTSVDAKADNTQQTLDELNAKKDQLSAEEYNKRQRELTTQLADLRVEKANAAAGVEESLAKKVEATNRKIIEGLELANQRASAAIQLSETNQTTGTKKKLLISGLIDRNEKVAGIEQGDIDADATQKRNALIQKEIQDYKKLAADKRISGKELNDKLLGFNQELAANNGKLVDLQIQKQKALRELFNLDVDHKVAADNRGTQGIIRNLERQKNAAEAVSKSLEITRKLTESRGGLQSAIAAYAQAKGQIGVDQANQKLELFNKASTEQDPDKQAGYQKLLQKAGFYSSGDDASDKEQLLTKKAEEEQKLADIKANALQNEYALKQQLLELDLKRDKLQAEQAVREAQIAELAARKEVRKSEGELKKALREGDPDKIAEAQDNLEGAQQGLTLSQQNTNSAREGLAATDQLAADSRAKLGVERSTAFLQNGQEQENLTTSQATERVEAGLDPDKVLNSGKSHALSLNFNPLPAFPQNRASVPAIPSNVTPAPDSDSGTVAASGATGDRLGSLFDSMTSALTQRLDILIELTRQDLGNPRSVTLHATDPVESYAQYQNKQTGNSLRNQAVY